MEWKQGVTSQLRATKKLQIFCFVKFKILFNYQAGWEKTHISSKYVKRLLDFHYKSL